MITIEDLNQKQREAFELLEEGNENLFITGAAGTGKSEVISLYSQLQEEEHVLVCAPTGMAALNCGGKTLHSAFRIRPKDYFEDGSYGEEEPTWLHRYDTLVIDEISLCRIDLFEHIMEASGMIVGTHAT